MEADRIRAARQRLQRAWVYGGLIWSIFFLGLAAVIAWVVGVERADELFTVIMGAMTLALGTYGIVYLGAVVIHVIKRARSGQPIMDVDD